jgi:hypothetical protein
MTGVLTSSQQRLISAVTGQVGTEPSRFIVLLLLPLRSACAASSEKRTVGGSQLIAESKIGIYASSLGSKLVARRHTREAEDRKSACFIEEYRIAHLDGYHPGKTNSPRNRARLCDK